MRKLVIAGLAAALSGGLMIAAVHHDARAAAAPKTSQVEFAMMTWPEVKAAIASGKTTALIYTGGTEQRGPQNVNGGHTLMAEDTVRAIAERLGNAIFLPVLPYTPNNASADLPGTIGLTNEILGQVLTRISEEAIKTGFKNVVLMGDHGGGQGPLGPKNVYDTVAKALDAKYAPQGIHVYYSDQTYQPPLHEFDVETMKEGYPYGAHGGISDTSLMMYLEHGRNWVRRELLPTAAGTPLDNNGKATGPDPHNGISGDARRSSEELGKRFFDLRVNMAVKQIQGFIPPKQG
jgi:creatinine amidohydrolase/Fe(II)-dependent formamide hydrolase-like protein